MAELADRHGEEREGWMREQREIKEGEMTEGRRKDIRSTTETFKIMESYHYKHAKHFHECVLAYI